MRNKTETVICRILLVATLWSLQGCGESGSQFDVTKVDFPFCEVDEGAADAVHRRLSLRQRIGQHLITGIQRSGTRVSADGERKIRDHFLGGVMVSGITGIAVGDPAASAAFLHHAQAVSAGASGVPLFISSDQEGGVYTSVNRMTGGTDSIGPAAIGATGDERVAFEQFDLMGREVAALGITMNFGPLLDTHYHRDNGNLNTRTFGPDPDLNARLGVAAMAGFQHNLVLPTVKHFPGDGMLAVNTHHAYAVTTATREELEARLLGPFRAAFAAGADGVMIMPAQFAALDDRRPAITSGRVMRDLLRNGIGFEGLIVTDDLNMYGARLGLTEDQEQGYEALKAGADLLLYVSIDDERLEALVARIEAGLRTGDLDETGFATSTRRILRYKQKYCLFEKPTYPDEADIASLGGRIGRAEDAALSLSHAERAVGLLHDGGILPLAGKRIVCVGPDRLLPDPASGWSWLLDESFCGVMQRLDPSVQASDFVIGLTTAGAFDWVVSHRHEADVVVAATFQAWFDPDQQALLDQLLGQAGLPVVHVAQGVPFDAIGTVDRAAAVVALQGSLPVMFEAGAKVLFGTAEASGRVLYDLSADDRSPPAIEAAE